MDPTVAITVFAIIFPAELPDKTAPASLVLGTRFRPLYVFAGVAAAFACHVMLAVAAGSLLPHQVLQIVVAASLLLGAVLLLRGRHEADEEHRELAAKCHDPLSVGVASALALWAVAGLAIVGGRSLLRVVSITLITRIAAAVMVLLAALSLYEAVK